MSAILWTCPDCGREYIAGMVGTTPWPAHACAIPSSKATPLMLMQNPLASIEFTEEQWNLIEEVAKDRGPLAVPPVPLDNEPQEQLMMNDLVELDRELGVLVLVVPRGDNGDGARPGALARQREFARRARIAWQVLRGREPISRRCSQCGLVVVAGGRPA